MIAIDFLNFDIPTIKPEDSVQRVLDWMNEYRVENLLIVEGKEYKGMISESAIYNMLDNADTISDVPLINQDIFVNENQHVIDVITKASSNELEVVPVLNEENEFLGSIIVRDILSTMSQLDGFNNPGGIIVIKIDISNFSNSELSKLIEAEGANILISYMNAYPDDTTKVKLTLKLNKTDLTSVISALQRYNYNVIEYYHKSEFKSQDKERLEGLLRYLQS